MDFDEKAFQVGLSMLPGIGPVTTRKLLAEFGTAEQVFRQNKKQLMQIPYVGEAIVSAMKDPVLLKRAKAEIDFAESEDIRIIFFQDEIYPKRLRHCYDSPVLLYSKGSVIPDNRKAVGIVGTRKATEYGKQLTEALVAELASQNVIIVSGLAYGIDILAHKAALENNVPTIGVLAHGLDTLYPAVHRSTAKKMLDCGGLICDYPSQTKPDKENFPMRNRIVAGLCDAVVVIESGESGGSMITAEFANNYNRDVFAFPGRVNDPLSAGCNKLIRTHKAGLITSPADLLHAMGWDEEKSKTKPGRQSAMLVNLSEDEEKIVAVLRDHDSVHADELAALTGFSTAKISTLLMQLEFAGAVIALPGKRYCLK